MPFEALADVVADWSDRGTQGEVFHNKHHHWCDYGMENFDRRLRGPWSLAPHAFGKVVNQVGRERYAVEAALVVVANGEVMEGEVEVGSMW